MRVVDEGVDTIVTPSTRSSVEAFLGLGCSRIVNPSDMDSQSILLELTFHNPVIQNRTSTTVQDPASLFFGAPTTVQDQDQDHVQDPAALARSSRGAPSSGLAPSMLSSPAARTWNRLRIVQAAFIDRDRLSSLELQDLRFILNALLFAAHEFIRPTGEWSPHRGQPSPSLRALILCSSTEPHLSKTLPCLVPLHRFSAGSSSMPLASSFAIPIPPSDDIVLARWSPRRKLEVVSTSQVLVPKVCERWAMPRCRLREARLPSSEVGL